MELSTVIARLGSCMKNGVVISEELRESTIRQYQDYSEDGIPVDAVVTLEFERPRSEKKLKKQLRKLEDLVDKRWAARLPKDFARLHIEYGRPVMQIRSADEDFGCAFSSPSEILRSHWLAEPVGIETRPDGCTQEMFYPCLPFMDANESEPVVFGFRHSPALSSPSIEWLIPDCFEWTDAGPVFSESKEADFSTWLNRWIEQGFPQHGPM